MRSRSSIHQEVNNLGASAGALATRRSASLQGGAPPRPIPLWDSFVPVLTTRRLPSRRPVSGAEDLPPRFQRRSHVCYEFAKSKLIRSMRLTRRAQVSRSCQNGCEERLEVRYFEPLKDSQALPTTRCGSKDRDRRYRCVRHALPAHLFVRLPRLHLAIPAIQNQRTLPSGGLVGRLLWFPVLSIKKNRL